MNPLFRDSQSPLDFNQINGETIRQATVEIQRLTEQAKEQLCDAPAEGKLRLNLFDRLNADMDAVLSPIYLLSETHPDQTIREEAHKSVETLFAYLNGLHLDEALYQAMRGFSQAGNALNKVEQRYIHQIMDDYQRNGFKLDRDGRATLKKLSDALNQVEILFHKNISECNEEIFLSESEMAGLPDSFKQAHLCEDGRYRITFDYPDYYAVLKYAHEEQVRRRFYMMFNNRCHQENLPLLDKMLQLRLEKADLLGFASYRDYTLENKMAKTSDMVRQFLLELSDKVKTKAEKDLRLLQDFSHQEEIPSWNRNYVANAYKQTHFDLNEEEVKAYFSLDAVINGLFHIAESLFGIQIKAVDDLSVWHEDVRVFHLHDETGLRGRFYLDLFPRPNKFNHAACFDIRSGRRIEDGSYRLPEAALVCNFTKPTPTRPCLLTHLEVETVFHEFGHLFHQLLTTSPFAGLAGTNVARDFVETPSQFFENWAWEKEALQGFALHYQTGETIPDALVDKMLAVRHFNSGIDIQQQIFYAMLDQSFHGPTPPEDSTALVAEIQSIYTLFPWVEGTHFQASFGHLVGYAASYYGYLWSEVYAQDCFSPFRSHGIFHRQTGLNFRRQIFATGDTADPMELMRAYLGREPQMDAFLESLGV